MEQFVIKNIPTPGEQVGKTPLNVSTLSHCYKMLGSGHITNSGVVKKKKSIRLIQF